MADNTLSVWQPFLNEVQKAVQEVFPMEAVFLAELSGFDAKAKATDHHSTVRRITREMDSNRDIFDGKYVKHPIVLAALTGGGFVKEAGTWNVPHALQDTEARINLVRFLFPFSVTVDVERDSMDHSAAAAVTQLVNQTRTALAKTENIAILGDGTGKVSDIAGGSSPGLVITVGTGANFDVLLPGTVWDIRTASTGADPGQGLRRKIDSVNESAGTVTFSTTAVASDGGSGNITFSANEDLYIPGSWSNGTSDEAPGALCAQGLEQAGAVTGTFENINKANVPQWQGVDGRAGDTAVLPLDTVMLGKGVRIGRRSGLGAWDFGLGDPAVIDVYKDSLLSLVRYDPEKSTLKSGFSGIVYDGADRPFPLIKEPAMAKGKLRLIDLASFQLYGDHQGPSFLEDDGGMFRRFSRNLSKEADMLDRFQLGVTKCNTIVKFDNLAVA